MLAAVLAVALLAQASALRDAIQNSTGSQTFSSPSGLRDAIQGSVPANNPVPATKSVSSAKSVTTGPSIEIEEDPIYHKKTFRLDLGKVASMTDGTLELAVSYYGDAKPRGPLPPATRLGLHFIAINKRWQFLNYRKVVLADGGSSIDLGEPKHRGDIGLGAVLEQFTTRITFGDMERLAAEANLKGKVGVQLFDLNNEQQKFLRKFVARMKVSEDEARKLDVAEKAQEEADKAKQRAEIEKEKDRLKAIREEWLQVRTGVIKRAKAGSPKSYQKNLNRYMDKAIDDFCRKYNMTPAELTDLAANPL